MTQDQADQISAVVCNLRISDAFGPYRKNSDGERLSVNNEILRRGRITAART